MTIVEPEKNVALRYSKFLKCRYESWRRFVSRSIQREQNPMRLGQVFRFMLQLSGYEYWHVIFWIVADIQRLHFRLPSVKKKRRETRESYQMAMSGVWQRITTKWRTYERVLSARHKLYLNFLAQEIFFFNFSKPVYKMWIIQQPNMLELWNKLHFGEKKTESIYHV